MANHNGQAVRKYRGGNITAAFSTDLFLQGITSVPSMLLCFYKKMGLSDTEALLLIHLFRLHGEERNYYPSTELLGELLAGGREQVERDLASLTTRGFLGLTEYYDKNGVTTGYDFEPLFERLSELWACSKVEEIEKAQAVVAAAPGDEIMDREFGQLCEEFSREFGRPLSPIEVEQIEHWAGSVPPLLVREALRRAVLMGKHNFKYIDRIILEWTKNNLRTLDEVMEFESRFEKRPGRSRKSPSRPSLRNGDKGSLKSLYV